jgi:hypothetical protein
MMDHPVVLPEVATVWVPAPEVVTVVVVATVVAAVAWEAKVWV